MFHPLCHTDHLSVQLTLRAQNKLKLGKRAQTTDAEKMRKLDHSPIRPFTPRFDPSTEMKWMRAAETHVVEHVDGTHHDRLQAAMMFVSLNILPERKKLSKKWCLPRSHVLDPLVRWRNACALNWRKQKGKPVCLVTEETKKDAVRVLNQAMREHHPLCVREEAKILESPMKSNYTKPAWDKLREFNLDLHNKHRAQKITRLKFANGVVSKSEAEDLQVFEEHVEKLFKMPRADGTVLNLVDQRAELDIDSLPTPTMIFNASRRLKHPAAGEDGTRAEHLRAVCRHKVGRINLFHDFVVERVQDWWLHGHEREAPRQWDACKTCTLFKKGDASNPGNCRSIMMLVVTQKLALILVGDRLQLPVGSLGEEHETQRGFCRKRGGADAIFNLRVALKKRQEHGLETWVAFLDLVKAFDSCSRELLWLILLKLGAPVRFVSRLRVLHARVMVHLKSGEFLEVIQIFAGVRQGDVIGPPLFNLCMAAVMITWRRVKPTPSVEFLTDASDSFVLHGRKGNAGVFFAFDASFCADDTAVCNEGRQDLTSDLRLFCPHIVRFAMLVHQGPRENRPSRSLCSLPNRPLSAGTL
jgi:hypothetical protein